MVAMAVQVETLPEVRLVIVTGTPAWNGAVYGQHSWALWAVRHSCWFAADQPPGTLLPPGVMMRWVVIVSN